jgi:hypothetical protein
MRARSGRGGAELLNWRLAIQVRPDKCGAMTQDELRTLICAGESESVEFKEAIPNRADDLSKEIAALASTNGGTLLIGVADGGELRPLQQFDHSKARRSFIERIEGICATAVAPAIQVLIEFVAVDGGTVALVKIPKGEAEIYYARGRPYVRRMSHSVGASPEEVKQRILYNDILRRLTELEGRKPEVSTAAAITGQGELATMNMSDVLTRLRQVEGRRFP